MQRTLTLTLAETKKIVEAALKSGGSDARWNALFCVRAKGGIFLSRGDPTKGKTRLQEAMAALEQENAVYGEVVRRRYAQKQLAIQVAASMHIGESTVYLYQREALDALGQLVWLWEQEAYAAVQKRIAATLPLTSYPQLVGIEGALDRLLAVVGKAEAPYLISIEGIGGIGKSSIADAILRRVMEVGLFDEVGWVSAQVEVLNKGGEILPTFSQEGTPEIIPEIIPESTSGGTQGNTLLRQLAEQLVPGVVLGRTILDEQIESILQQRLQEVAHLVVLDNLETVTDRPALLAKLRRMGGPSKFLLTTRESLYSEEGVFRFSMQELAHDHALHLIRQEAELSNLPEVAAAADGELDEIYATVGGNPLALRLVVGQLHLYPLYAILADLRSARGLTAEALYTFIYWQAWQRLDEVGRQTLLATALFGVEGDTLEYLAQISMVGIEGTRAAIQQLVKLNLVELRGDLMQRRYAIHGLTRTFLLEQVAKWL